MDQIVHQVAPIVIQEATKYISKRALLTPAQELANSASENNTSTLRRQLEHDPDVNRGPALVAAAGSGSLSALELLLEPPEKVSSRHSHHHREPKVDLDVWSSGATPLLAAVRGRHLKTTKCVLESGADPDLAPKTGITALEEAAQAGLLDVVNLLLVYGAKADHHDHKGDTALIIASRWGHSHTARCLLQNGAKVNEQNMKGSTALGVAARHDSLDAVVELLKWKANPNLRDKKGRTALHRAVEGVWLIDGVSSKRKEEMVQVLLDAGADPRVKDKEGKTPAERASWLTGSEALRKLLNGDRRKDVYKGHGNSRSKTF